MPLPDTDSEPRIGTSISREPAQEIRATLSHGARQVAVAMRALGRTGYLDLDDQQGQRDCENRIAEALEAVEPALGAMTVGATELHLWQTSGGHHAGVSR